MGWDQTTQRQSVMSFLMDLMGIDQNQLLLEALQAKMAEKGLTYEAAPAEGREEGDGMYNSFTPDVIALSDGRVFIEAQTETTQGDDWGNDYYSFVEVGKSFTFTRNDYCGCVNDPHISREEMVSTHLPDLDTRQHHPECNDITRCHPDCAFARERASEDPVVSTANNVLRPDISFGHKGKSFTREEIRESNTEFGGAIADFMKKQGIDNISFEPGDEE